MEPYSFSVYGTAWKDSALVAISELLSMAGFFGAIIYINGKSEKETTRTQKYYNILVLVKNGSLLIYLINS